MNHEFHATQNSMPNDAAAAPSQEDMIRNLVDLTSLLILSATSQQGRTVRDLSMELNLPIATLYRKVRSLQTAGALNAHKIKDRMTGKETMVYESALTGVRISFGEAGSPAFEVGYREGDAHDAHDDPLMG